MIDVGQPETIKGDKNSYDKILVSYKNKEGKVSGKTLVSFPPNTSVFNFFKNEVSSGDIVTVDVEKNGQFWNWKSAVKGYAIVGDDKDMTKPTQVKKWVSDEERQCMIMRQNALTNAVNWLVASPSPKKKLGDVIETAEFFYSWTHDKKDPVQKVIEMEDDVPQ